MKQSIFKHFEKPVKYNLLRFCFLLFFKLKCAHLLENIRKIDYAANIN